MNSKSQQSIILQSQALNPMQKAYLLGKSGMFPLSQSSMHDFREFHGMIILKRFEQTLAALVKKYSALRTLIDEQALIQHVIESIQFTEHFQSYDFSNDSIAEAQQQVQQLREHYSHYQHDLSTPPWKICLIQMPTAFAQDSAFNSIVFTSFDGLIIDGYSISSFVEELFSLDTDADAILASIQPEVQQATRYFSATEKEIQFWQDRIVEVEGVIQLPWLKPLDKISKPNYKRKTLSLTATQFKHLTVLATQQKILPNCLLTTLVLDVLARWTPDQKLLISMPISTSSMSEGLANQSSFIVLNHQFEAEQGLIDMAQTTQKNILHAMAHSSYSGIEISRLLMKKTQDSIVLPVTITNGLSWKKPPQHPYVKEVDGLTQTPQLALDIRLSLNAKSDLKIDLDYAVEALSDQLIEDFKQALAERLNHVAQAESLMQIDQRQSAVSAILATDQIPDDFQHTLVADYLQHIQDNLFLAPPDKTALIYEGTEISYAKLAEGVSKLRAAMDQAGVEAGQVVAICLRKSPEHVYAILACALTGVIWLPVDMDSPLARQRFILKNSCAHVVISKTELEGYQTINVDQALQHSNDLVACKNLIWQHHHDASPAYYLYTSGSTGTPKCVVLNNRATANVMQETIKFWAICEQDIHLAATPFHHDMSIFDIMAPLSVGGTLVIPSYEQSKNAVVWAELIEKYKVSIWCTVPAMADMLLTAAHPRQLQSIRLINQGGDYVKPAVVKKLREILPQTRLISIGGPTETTIWSIWHEITEADQDVIPYGKDVLDNHYYILNARGEFCPPGVVGQLYMTGINLANGYLVDGQIIQTDFVWLTLENGERQRAFRMSDKGFLRSDGNIIFAGRDEGYLKIRGVRMAASEIENALLNHADIHDCVVTMCTNPVYEGSELVAIYATNASNSPDLKAANLRKFLQQYVPDSHIPSRWLALSQFPITANGKINRKELKQIAQTQLYQTSQKPLTQTENHTKSPVNQGLNTILEQQVVQHLNQTLARSDVASLMLDTEILAVGITPRHLNRLASHFSQQLQQPIDFIRLAKCKTIGDIVSNIHIQMKMNEEKKS